MFNLVADICPYTSVYDPISEKTYVVMDTELGETYNSPEICLSSKSLSSKHVRIRFASGPYLLGNIDQKRPGWFLHIGVLSDRIRLAKTWHSQTRTKSDPG